LSSGAITGNAGALLLNNKARQDGQTVGNFTFKDRSSEEEASGANNKNGPIDTKAQIYSIAPSTGISDRRLEQLG
jgi:hypothetical protein